MNNETWIVDLSQYNDEIWRRELECNTREEAIKEGTLLAQKNGLSKFRIGQQEFGGIPSIDVECALEIINEEMQDEYGEVAEDYLQNLPKEEIELLSQKVDLVFREWLKETNNEPGFYHVYNEETITITEAQDE